MSLLLLLAGVIAPALFVAVFLIEGATRRGYDPLRQPVSALALGEGGWTQKTAFIVTGALTIGFVAGLWEAPAVVSGIRWVAGILGLYSIGMIGSGLFVTDPIGDYPPNTPLPSQPSRTGLLHGLFSLLVFVPLFAACLVAAILYAAAGSAVWAAYSALSAITFGVGFVLFGRAMSSSGRLGRLAGLLQRATIIIGWTWIVLLALHVLGARGL